MAASSGNRSFLSRWQSEYFAPVVVTLSTAEVEKACLENSLLFHELLSAFGHLDAVNSTIRTGGGPNISISDSHIRFERVSEVVHKSSGVVEELLRDAFTESNFSRIPTTTNGIRGNPPTAWTSKIEQLLMHSVSFSEFEMASNPIILLTVVSTHDDDPVRCMQELASVHHMPPCFFTGQYDPDIRRVYVLLHDNSKNIDTDVDTLLLQMKLSLAPATVKLLRINSLPTNEPHLQQPNIWENSTHPLFFPQHAPTVEAIPILKVPSSTPTTVVKGCHLSVEDLMGLRSFCSQLFVQEIIPALERRISYLSKSINENKKGVKNVLKNLWRKPREDGVPAKGKARYKYDRIESQILLLADTCFALQDYETAGSMYRLVKEDFKSDKSIPHLAHTSLMLAACHLFGEANTMISVSNSTAVQAALNLRSAALQREIATQLEVLSQCMSSSLDPTHSAAYFTILAAELHTSTALMPATRSPLEAAHLLLTAAAGINRLPLLCALLTEKAATYLLQGGLVRRYAFHEVLAGYKFYSSGRGAIRHAMVCFTCALVTHETGNWNTLKLKLYRVLADELSKGDETDSKKAFVLLLHIIFGGFGGTDRADRLEVGDATVPSKGALQEIASAVKDVCAGGAWGSVSLSEGWQGKSAREIVMGDFQVSDVILPNTSSISEVCSLPLPEVIKTSTSILLPVNGKVHLSDTNRKSSMKSYIAALETMYKAEKDWTDSQKQSTKLELNEELLVTLLDGTSSSALALPSESHATVSSSGVAIYLGELVHVSIEIRNRLPTPLVLSDSKLTIEPSDAVLCPEEEFVVAGNTKRTIILTAHVQNEGKYRITGVRWTISKLTVHQSLQKAGGLLHRTLAQRVSRERTEDTSLDFKVLPPHALLHVQIIDFPKEILQGEVFRTYIVITNEGCSDARNIELKFNQPRFIIDYNPTEILSDSDGTSNLSSTAIAYDTKNCVNIPYTGVTGTVFALPDSVVLSPKNSIRIGVWARLETRGLQQLGVLVSYGCEDQTPRTSTGIVSPVYESVRRTSVIAFETQVFPSFGLDVRCFQRPNHRSLRTLLFDVTNRLDVSSLEADEAELSAGRVDSIWLVGGASVPSDGGKFVMGLGDDELSTRIRPLERLTLCVPIVVRERILTPQNASVVTADETMTLTGVQCWPLPPTATVDLVQAVESLICLNFIEKELRKNLLKARQKNSANIRSSPRSISSVRRENVKGAGEAAVSHGQGGVISDSDLAQFMSSSTLTATVIADREASTRGIAMALGWTCEWRGTTHRGVLHAFGVPLLPMSISSSVSSSTSKLAADFLSATIQHPTHAQLDPVEDDLLATVEVILELRALGSQCLTIWADALDWESQAPTYTASPTKPLSADELDNIVSNTEGCRWLGKVRYESVKVTPTAPVQLKFRAMFTRSGVYDLRSFRITVDFADDESSTPSVKAGLAQSLIKVLDPPELVSKEISLGTNQLKS